MSHTFDGFYKFLERCYFGPPRMSWIKRKMFQLWLKFKTKEYKRRLYKWRTWYWRKVGEKRFDDMIGTPVKLAPLVRRNLT